MLSYGSNLPTLNLLIYTIAHANACYMIYPNVYNLRKRFRYLLAVLFIPAALRAQEQNIRIESDPAQRTVTVTADGKPFTTFIYSDKLEKPVLYPIYASDEQLITRGFPINPRPGEPVDHPHHVGLWFNYENVNGLDFWNNSYAI